MWHKQTVGVEVLCCPFVSVCVCMYKSVCCVRTNLFYSQLFVE